METVKGLKNSLFPLEDLTHVTDLIYFDGPLLSHFKSKTGSDYLYYWCDVDENYNRWLVFEATNLDQYLAGKVSLRELIENASPIYAVDIDDDLQYHRNARLVGSLPESYLPDADSYYEEIEEEETYTIPISIRSRIPKGTITLMALAMQ